MALTRTARGRFATTRSPSLSGTTVEGTVAFNRAIDKLAVHLDDFLPTLEVVAERGFYPLMQEIFDSENRGRWDALTPGYADWKQRHFGDKPIMQLTGALMTALTTKGAAYNIHIGIGKGALAIGTSLPYGVYASGRRPVFQFSDKDFGVLAEIASEDVAKRAAELGFGVDNK